MPVGSPRAGFVPALPASLADWDLTAMLRLPRRDDNRRALAITLVLVDHAGYERGDAAPPGLIGVSAQIDGLVEQDRAGRGVLDPDIDVENEVAHLLHPADQHPVGLQRLRDVELTAVAVAQG